MNTKTINIKNPSEKATAFFKKLRMDKEAKKLAFIAKKDIYFPKTK